MTRVLYGYWRSSAAFRVRIGLNLKGLGYDLQPVDLRAGAQQSPGYTLLNPQGLVPFLIDGAVGLNQSLAILEYLDEAYPETARLLPPEPLARARVRAAAEIIACEAHPLGNLRVLRYLKNQLGQEQAAIDDWYRHWMVLALKPLEEIAQASRGDYLFGDAVTLADICLAPHMYNSRRMRVDLEPFPHLVAIDKRLNALEAVRRAAPQNQPDAVPE